MQQRRLFYFAKTKQWPRLPNNSIKTNIKHIKKKEMSLNKAREYSMYIKRAFLYRFANVCTQTTVNITDN
jgi:hypothetical protein